VARMSVCLHDCQAHFALLQEFADSLVIVTTNRLTDRETAVRHQLTLECTDSGQPALSSHINVVVNVLDVDDHAPRFQQSVYNCSVRENSQPLEVTFHAVLSHHHRLMRHS